MLPPLWFRLSASGRPAANRPAPLPADTFWRQATRGVTPEQAGERAVGTGDDAELTRAVAGLLAGVR